MQTSGNQRYDNDLTQISNLETIGTEQHSCYIRY